MLAILLLVLFVWTERRVWNPLVDVALFTDRLFAVGTLLRGATEFASLGVFFALSHFMQVQLGYSAVVTGLLLLAIIGGAVVTSPVAETLSGRVDVRWLVIPGFLLVAAGTFWVAHIEPQTNWTFFLAPLAVAGAGFGLLEAPTTSATQRDIPPTQGEAAWRVSYTIYLLGIGLEVAMVSGVWQHELVANIQAALSRASLPPEVVDRMFASLSEGGVNSPGPARITGLIQETFAQAIHTALLSCVIVAALGAAVALFCSSNRKQERATQEPGGS